MASETELLSEATLQASQAHLPLPTDVMGQDPLCGTPWHTADLPTAGVSIQKKLF